MEKQDIGLIIAVGIALLMGAIFVSIIAEQTIDNTQLTGTTETIDIASARLYVWAGNVTIPLETLTTVDNVTGENFAVSAYTHVICVLNNVTNATGGELLTVANYTQHNCHINTTAVSEYIGQDLNVSYIYNYMTYDGAVNNSIRFTLTNAIYDGFRTDLSECEVTSITLKNQTGTALTPTTDYTFTADTAILTLNNVNALNSSSSNTTTAVYSYCADDYVGGWARTITNMVPGFFALALLGAAIFVIYIIMKREGLDLF